MTANHIVAWMQTWQPDPRWANQKTIGREDLPLLFASVEHRAWVRNVEHHVRGHSGPTGLMSMKDCRIGQWLQDTGREQYGEFPSFGRVTKLHHLIHDLATDLCKSAGEQDERVLEQGLHELNGLRDDLIRELNTLI